MPNQTPERWETRKAIDEGDRRHAIALEVLKALAPEVLCREQAMPLLRAAEESRLGVYASLAKNCYQLADAMIKAGGDT